jgi:hypothetical protein
MKKMNISNDSKGKRKKRATIAISVADPELGSGAFLPLDSGPDAIFPDLGYPTHIPESFIIIIFWEKQ